MGHAERIQERPDIVGQASARYGSRGVPDDWFLDPADPGAGGRYREDDLLRPGIVRRVGPESQGSMGRRAAG